MAMEGLWNAHAKRSLDRNVIFRATLVEALNNWKTRPLQAQCCPQHPGSILACLALRQ